MLSAGTCVEWLRDDLGIIDDGGRLATTWRPACDDTGDVWFVPALLGLGTPVWDFGARGTFVGITRGTGRPEMVRAVLEGVAHRGADLLEAAEADTAMTIATLRVDGGMSANPTFVDALADAVGRPVEISPVTEATTLGAAYLAGMALGRVGRRGRGGRGLAALGGGRAPVHRPQAGQHPGPMAGGPGAGPRHRARAERPGVLSDVPSSLVTRSVRPRTCR